MADNTKVYFDLPDRGETESLWAEPVGKGQAGDLFKLLNSPFFFKGVSFLDVVLTKPRPSGNGFDFVQVISHSGNSTYRVIADPAVIQNSLYWRNLEAKGCTYESASYGEKMLYAINIPPDADIFELYEILEMGEKEGAWVFEEGHVGHNLTKKIN